MLGRRRSLRSFVAALAGLATLFALLLVSVAPAQAATPDVPSGLTPSGGASASGIPTLTWARSLGATGYDVQVSASASFSTIAWSTSTVNSQAVPTAQVPQGLDYWRVRAKNSSGTSAWAVESFTRDAVGAPTLLSPLGDTLKEPDNPPVLSWVPVSGATSYSVQVSSDSTFADSNAITSFSTKVPSLVVSTLKVPNTYYWRVQASLGAGLTTAWADPASYTLEGLTAPSLVGPTPDSVNTDVQNVVLHWSAVPGAVTYDVEVSTDQDFLTSAASQNGVVGTSYSPPTTLNNDQYYWRVRPVDASGNKLDWSQVAVWHFRRNWPDQPTLQYPADGANVSDPFYYQWTPTHHASGYEVQMSTSSSFPEDSRTHTCTTVGTTLVPGQNENLNQALACMPAAATTYYWRVMAIDDPKGVQSDVISAEVGHFTYSPPMVSQVSPTDGASVQVPTMTWDPVAGSAQYRLTYTDTTSGNSTTVTTSGLSFTPRTLLTVGHTYRWQVQTVSGSGQVGASLLAGGQPTFTVIAQDPPVATIPAATDSPDGQRFPTLTWDPVVSATKYQLYVRPSGTTGYTQVGTNFAYPAGEDSGTSWLTPGSYDWIVEAYNGSSLLSQTTTHGTFTITALAAVTNGRAVADRQPDHGQQRHCHRQLRRDAAQRVPEPSPDAGPHLGLGPQRRLLQALLLLRRRDDEQGRQLLADHRVRQHVVGPEGTARQPGRLGVLLGGGALPRHRRLCPARPREPGLQQAEQPGRYSIRLSPTAPAPVPTRVTSATTSPSRGRTTSTPSSRPIPPTRY